MNLWLKRVLFGFIVAAFQYVLIQYMKFSFIPTLVLFVLLAFLMNVLEHKNFAWGIIIGSILVAVFGWMVFDGWVKPTN